MGVGGRAAGSTECWVASLVPVRYELNAEYMIGWVHKFVELNVGEHQLLYF